MTNAELIEKLNSLIKLDNDALHSYDKVIEAIDHKDLKDQITAFRDDHRHHVNNLSDLVTSYGGVPARKESDIIGNFLGGATIISKMIGIEGSLNALYTGELLTNKTYAAASGWDVPSEVQAIIKVNYSDEQRHKRFIENALRDKVWEKR